ncbi:MAG: hypothetical protein CJBNEKGG_04440 [Prosthecobacter sp.]|nr:hypothetical protein [Prosthecobacter sp.]
MQEEPPVIIIMDNVLAPAPPRHDVVISTCRLNTKLRAMRRFLRVEHICQAVAH